MMKINKPKSQSSETTFNMFSGLRVTRLNALISSATLFLFLALYFTNSLYADDHKTVARTLKKDESVSIFSYRCKLSVKSASESQVIVGCSKKLKKRFNIRPVGKPYLGPKQVAAINAKKCSLDVRVATSKNINIKCGAEPEPTPSPSPSLSPSPSPTSTPTPTPTPTASPTPTITPAYTIGGTISGLSGSVGLQNNGADDLTLSSNGSFTFSTPLLDSSSYNATVLLQPASQTCSITNASGTVSGSNITNISVNCVTNTTTLSASLSDLALSVTGLTEYGISGTPSSGLARIIVVTNTGSYTAENLSISLPTFPSGTTSSTTCGSTLAPSSSCTITVTPGSSATSDGTDPCTGGTAPVPGTIQITADNSTTVTTNVVVLGYGCIYQGGHVFAFDDTTPNTSSVGGKVMTTADQAASFPNGIIWSSNGLSSDAMDTSYDIIPGIDETSTTSTGSPDYATFSSFFSSTYTNMNPFMSSSFANCNGATDGSCNTLNIATFYNLFFTTNTTANGGTPPFTALELPTNTTFYAAGLCLQTISSYSDWYLPAICELGYGATACGTAMTPTLQNAQSSLVDYTSPALLSGYYQSSTENSINPSTHIWMQFFDSSGGSLQNLSSKNSLLGVRCVRQLTL